MSTRCQTPIYVKPKESDPMECPCGKCPACLKRRASSWSFRLMQEEKHCKSSYFLTLTYDNQKHNRDSITTDKRYLSLRRRHLQLFFKRVRKKMHSKSVSSINVGSTGRVLHLPLKYYAVGEYGSQTFRPHYHVLIFNFPLELFLSKIDMLRLRHHQFDGATGVKLEGWDYGHVTVGKVTGASIGYCLKYMSKPKRIPMHQNDDRIPEFSLMSKGIGECYLTPQMVAWHRADIAGRMYLNYDGKKKCAMPRYYKERIYSKYERQVAGEMIIQSIREKDVLRVLLNRVPTLHEVVESNRAAVKRMHRVALHGRQYYF